MKIERKSMEPGDNSRRNTSLLKMLSVVFPLFVILLGLASCENFFESVVEVDLPEHQPLLAVHSFTSTTKDSTIKVLVTRSRGIFEEESDGDYLNDAQVNLSSNLGEIQLTSLPIEQQFNSRHFNFESEEIDFDEEVEFELQVEFSNMKAVHSTQIIPALTMPDSVVYVDNAGLNQDGFRSSALDIYFNDPAGIENYYQIIANYSPDPEFGEQSFYIESIDPATTPYGRSLLVSDLTFNGEEKRLRVIFENYFGDSEAAHFFIEWKCITEDLYRYGRSIERYENSYDNPFITPAQLFTNIEDGLGVFAISRSVEITAQ